MAIVVSRKHAPELIMRTLEVLARPTKTREEAATSLLDYIGRMFPSYQPAECHHRIAEALESIERRDLDRVVITIPPRHGKSTIASEHFPPWYLGRNPDERIIAASYAASLAYRFSRRARNLLADPRSPFTAKPAGDLASVQAWDIEGRRGGYVAAGVGGAITGMGADVLLVDDPVKSADEADSEAYRERAWEWFTQTALTRLEPGGRVVLIGTRWHEDDLIGRALNMDGAGWTHLDMPAFDDTGEALWPERYPVAALERIRAQIGSRAFQALYQQRPSPAEGTILKREWWGYWRHPLPQIDWVIQSWDTAFKAKSTSDYSACVTFGASLDGWYVLDRWRDRVEFPDLKRAAVEQYTRWKPNEVVVEDKASGQSLIQSLQSETRIPVVPFTVDPDKVARAHAVSPAVESGSVKLPADAPWLDEFLTECAAFPLGKHDDQVDALTIGLSRLILRDTTLRPADGYLLSHFVGYPGLADADAY